LEDALNQLIDKAKRKIVICSCEFSKSDFILNERIKFKLNSGCEIIIFGNHKSQMIDLRKEFEDFDNLMVYSWNEPRKKSLFHIKSITIDGNHCYIGSANLSINAMKNSSEWGIITDSPDLCGDLNDYVNELISLGRFEEVNI